jgi:hypothetical protein
MFSEGGKNRLSNELMERNFDSYFIVTIDTFNISLLYHQLYLSLYSYAVFMASVLGNSMSCTYSILCKALLETCMDNSYF